MRVRKSKEIISLQNLSYDSTMRDQEIQEISEIKEIQTVNVSKVVTVDKAVQILEEEGL